MNNTREVWLQTGYQFFASGGPDELKIERLAKRIGKNKSSFYHFFADLDLFTRHLLTHHLTQAK